MRLGRPTTDDRRPTTDDRRPTTDDRRPTTDDRRPTTDDRRPTTDDRTEGRRWTTGQSVREIPASFGRLRRLATSRCPVG
jgi:hypothetical protein